MKVLLAVILLVPFIIVYALGFYEILGRFSFLHSPQFYYWTAALGSLLLSLLFIPSGFFAATFKHELTHNAFAILTFKKPMGFNVSADGSGHFQYIGKSNVLIALSPYFFPIITSLLLLFSFFGVKEVYYYHIALGLATGFDASVSLKDIHPYQTDFKPYGYITSLIIIILGFLLIYGTVIAFVQGGKNNVFEYWIGGIENLYHYIKAIIK